MVDPDEPGNGYARRPVTQLHAGIARTDSDLLAEEVPVAVSYDGAPFAVMMASPGDLQDFAYGFSLTEGHAVPADIADIEVRTVLEGILLDIRTRNPASGDAVAERLLPGRSGCGICGTRLLEEVVKRPVPVPDGVAIDITSLELALAALQEHQPLNKATGATHAAAWASADGTLMLLREDVGRHNALDKLIGAMMRGGIDPTQGFALVTSRASYEMVTKAAIAGIGLLAAISAPTALAVDLARDCGLTLAGFARPGRQVIYSHPHRLRGQTPLPLAGEGAEGG
ncbi:formate dehydrogenase accessory sulfurtransferase FdhD [Pseudoxanthomonas sacheonensis]|uniref:formate dehydrogenase accessory sulfurtransferase FdhD n=1 Tax=Pseudoxanthomonas sacheonensis TaxID=443615 RepID=UPI0013D1FAF7|nr:formate dehydrogenase accessory sulfurtransferase FdhD [Pseudoxanthomonas sacheonensis]KAF1708713.1 sulfurtransferase FdhD [Pseudoxanthomonas sacheonensis]